MPAILLPYSSTATLHFPLIGSGTAAFITGASGSLVGTNIQITKDGSAWATSTNTGTHLPGSGFYRLALTDTELAAKEVWIAIGLGTLGTVIEHQAILIHTYGSASAMYENINGSSFTASTALGTISANVVAMANSVITSAVIDDTAISSKTVGTAGTALGTLSANVVAWSSTSVSGSAGFPVISSVNTVVSANAVQLKGTTIAGTRGTGIAEPGSALATATIGTVTTDVGITSAAVSLIWDKVLSAATHNIANSAGRRIRQLQESAAVYAEGAIWIDTVNGSAGTTNYENGTPDNPVDNIADANTLASSLGISRFRVAPGSTITLAAAQNNQIFEGWGWTLALGGQDVAGSSFVGATVSGVMSGAGTTQYFIDCIMGAVSIIKGTHYKNCAISGNQTLVEAGDIFIIDCRSAVAGDATPILDWGGAIANSNVSIRAYSGGFQFENMGDSGTDTCSFEGWGQLIEGTCTGGTVTIRGNISTSGITNITVTEIARVDNNSIATAIGTGTIGVNLIQVSGIPFGTSVGTNFTIFYEGTGAVTTKSVENVGATVGTVNANVVQWSGTSVSGSAGFPIVSSVNSTVTAEAGSSFATATIGTVTTALGIMSANIIQLKGTAVSGTRGTAISEPGSAFTTLTIGTVSTALGTISANIVAMTNDIITSAAISSTALSSKTIVASTLQGIASANLVQVLGTAAQATQGLVKANITELLGTAIAGSAGTIRANMMAINGTPAAAQAIANAASAYELVTATAGTLNATSITVKTLTSTADGAYNGRTLYFLDGTVIKQAVVITNAIASPPQLEFTGSLTNSPADGVVAVIV